MTKHWRGTGSVKGRAIPGAAPKSSKNGKIFALLAIMVALAGAIIGMLFFYRSFHAPDLISIPVTEYDTHLPPNAFALQDGERVRTFFNAERGKDAYENQERDRFVKALQGLSRHKDRPLVLYISAHALVRGQEVYILPGDAKPDDSNTWLSLKEILRYLSECPSDRKLLILDVMQPIANARLGVLVDEIASGAAEILKAHEDTDEHLLVLCPCSPGQVSQVSEEMGNSVFAHYLAQGLAGAAERYNRKEASDSRVSVQELAEFVKVRVDRWVHDNRGLSQTPVLYGKGKDFHLVAVKQKPVVGISETAQGEAEGLAPVKPTYPDWLAQDWEVRDRICEKASYRHDPQAFRELEGMLLWAEKAWRGQVDVDKVRTGLDRTVGSLQRRIDRAAGEINRVLHPEGSKPSNLTMAFEEWKAAQTSRGTNAKPNADGKSSPAGGSAPPAKPEEALGENLSKLFAKVDRLSTLTGKDRDEAKAALDKARADLAEQYKTEPMLLAWTVFLSASTDPSPSQPKLQFAVDLLKPIPAAPPALQAFRETLMLHRLADLKPDDSGKWPADTVAHALRMTRLAEKAALASPRAFPWVRHLLEETAPKRRQAEAALFDPDPVRNASAGPLLEAAERKYAEIDTAAHVVQEAQETLDRAWMRLPAHMSYLNQHVGVALADAGWTGAMESATALAEILTRPPPAGALALQLLRTRTDELQEALRKLERPYQAAAMEELTRQAKRNPTATYQEVDAILSTPYLGASERAKLWLLQRELGERLHARTVERDREDDSVLRLTRYSSSTAGTPTEAPPGKVAAGRARLVLDLFKLGGMAQLSELEHDWQSLVSSPSNWRDCAEKIQSAWSKSLRSQYEQKLADQKWQEADRLGRLFSPFDLESLDQDDLSRNPTVQQAKVDARAFRAWLEKQ